MSLLVQRYSPWVDYRPFAEAKMHRDGEGSWVYHASHVAALAELRKALAPLAEVARINDLYTGPPCNNSPHPDSKTVLYYQHGDDEVRITLGDCRRVRELLSS